MVIITISVIIYGLVILILGYTLSIFMITRDFNLFILVITNFPITRWNAVAIVVEEDDRLDSSIKYNKDKFLELLKEHSF